MSRQLMLDVFAKMQTEIKQAQRLTDQGELIKAEAIYLDVLEREQNYSPALYGLAELANKIDEQEVRDDLLDRAIGELNGSTDRNKKGLVAIWLTERAEAMIKLGRQDDAKQYIAESEKIIKQNLS